MTEDREGKVRQCYYEWEESLGVELSEVVPAEAGIGHPLVVVIVDVLVPDDARELGLLQLAASQQSDLLQFLHALHQLPGAVDHIRIGLEGLDHGALEVGLLAALLEEALQAATVGVVDQAGLVPELGRMGGDGVVADPPGDTGGAD